MCADGAKAPEQRFVYSNAISAMGKIWREESLAAFYRGLGPNVVRSVLMSKCPTTLLICTSTDIIKTCHKLLCKSLLNILNSSDQYSSYLFNRYTKAKSALLGNSLVELKDGIPIHILASLIAGTVATTVCAPADVLKSRMQSAAAVDGKKKVRNGYFAHIKLNLISLTTFRRA